MGYRHLDDSGLGLSQVDLSDPRFVEEPERLSIIFRSFVQNDFDPNCSLVQVIQ